MDTNFLKTKTLHSDRIWLVALHSDPGHQKIIRNRINSVDSHFVRTLETIRSRIEVHDALQSIYTKKKNLKQQTIASRAQL